MSDIMSMALTEPVVVDVDDIATREAAALRASTIRIGIGRFVDIVVPEILAAWAQRDWVALGYDSWEAYVEGELGVDRLKLTRESRRAAIAVFRVAGMSTRAIGAALDVDQSTVVRDLPSLDSDASPETVTGTDGRTYPATQPAADREPEDDFGNKRSDYGDDDDDLADDDFETFVDVGQDDPDDDDESDRDDLGDENGCDRCSMMPGEVGPLGVTCACSIGQGAPAHLCVCGRPIDDDEPATPDSDWLESPSEGGAVTSSTPGNPTAEAPADIDPDVEYDAWRSRIYAELSNASRHLANLSGGWQDADVFATQASEKQMVWLADMASGLAAFVSRVRSLRPQPAEPVDPEPETAAEPVDPARALWRRAHAWAEANGPDVWIAAERKGIDYHRPTPGLPEGKMHPLTGCGLSMNARGQLLGIAIVEFRHSSTPCAKCWPETVDKPTEPNPDEVRARAYAWQSRMKADGADARIWMEARRGNLPYHRPVGFGGRRSLVQLGCGRERTKGGAYLEIGTAVSVHGAHPCPRCWPDDNEEA